MTFSQLRLPVLPESLLADYLAAIYRERLGSADLAAVRLDQFEWLWNFAPLAVECLYVPRSGESSWPSAMFNEVCRQDSQVQREAGASRVSWNRGLKELDEFGFGMPSPMGRCEQGVAAASVQMPRLPSRALPGTAGHELVLEVIRISTDAYHRGDMSSKRLNHTKNLVREGGDNGCWYIAKRGTGIFLRTGRTLSVENRSQLAAQLRIDQAALRREPCALHCDDKSVDAKGMPRATLNPIVANELISRGVVGTYKPRTLEDFIPLCPRARALGFETIIIQNHLPIMPEVVSCSDLCVAQPLPDACVPGLLTGWRASLPCECDPSLKILNCASTAAPVRFPIPRGSVEYSPRRFAQNLSSGIRFVRKCCVEGEKARKCRRSANATCECQRTKPGVRPGRHA